MCSRNSIQEVYRCISKQYSDDRSLLNTYKASAASNFLYGRFFLFSVVTGLHIIRYIGIPKSHRMIQEQIGPSVFFYCLRGLLILSFFK